jgi:hypothetical protein
MEEVWGQSHSRAMNGATQVGQAALALALGLCLASIGLSGCSGCLGIANSGHQAQTLAAGMHRKMADSDQAGIYDGADQRYKSAVSREKSDALFSAVASKLGAPQDCKQKSFNVMAATWGTTIRLVCETTFSKGATGMETFVWVKSGDQFKLLSYHIDSEELIER